MNYSNVFKQQLLQKDKEIQEIYAYHDLQVTRQNARYIELQENHSKLQQEITEKALALQEKTELHSMLKQNYIDNGNTHPGKRSV